MSWIALGEEIINNLANAITTIETADQAYEYVNKQINAQTVDEPYDTESHVRSFIRPQVDGIINREFEGKVHAPDIETPARTKRPGDAPGISPPEKKTKTGSEDTGGRSLPVLHYSGEHRRPQPIRS